MLFNSFKKLSWGSDHAEISFQLRMEQHALKTYLEKQMILSYYISILHFFNYEYLHSESRIFLYRLHELPILIFCVQKENSYR
jgi:hypothetical protein